MILPVLVEMTTVASVSLPDITAREDASTVIAGGWEDEKELRPPKPSRSLASGAIVRL